MGFCHSNATNVQDMARIQGQKGDFCYRRLDKTEEKARVAAPELHDHDWSRRHIVYHPFNERSFLS